VEEIEKNGYVAQSGNIIFTAKNFPILIVFYKILIVFYNFLLHFFIIKVKISENIKISQRVQLLNPWLFKTMTFIYLVKLKYRF
jgi:hypothetical protein